MNPIIKNWQDFLDSLATSGGNIVTLFFSSVFSGLLWVWVYAHDTHGTVMTASFGVFTGFTGALLQAQKGNSSRQQMTDRIETAGGVQVPPPAAPPPAPQVQAIAASPAAPVTPADPPAPAKPWT